MKKSLALIVACVSLMNLCITISAEDVTKKIDSGTSGITKFNVEVKSVGNGEAGSYGYFQHFVDSNETTYVPANPNPPPAPTVIDDVEDYIPENFDTPIEQSQRSLNPAYYVNNVQTSTKYNKNCLIVYRNEYDDRMRAASGFIIGNHAVATAGHVTYDQTAGWAKDITIYVANDGYGFSNGTTANCFLKQTGYKTVMAGGEWVSSGNELDDWGIITTVDDIAAGGVGRATFKAVTFNGILGSKIDNAGYLKNDNPYFTTENFVLAKSNGTVVRNAQKALPAFRCDAWADHGMSGGPIYEENTSQIIGFVRGSEGGLTKAVMINDWLYNAYREYRY